MALKKTTKLLFILIPIIVLSGLVYLFFFTTYSKGVRSGVVIKVSERGVLFKTREGQLNLQTFGAVKSNNQFAEIFEFTIDKKNDSLYHMLQEVSLSGERVKLNYEQKYLALPWHGDTEFIVVGMETMEAKVDESKKNKKAPKKSKEEKSNDRFLKD